MDMDEAQYSQLSQIGATVIILRKSRRSIEFVKKWREYCENPQILTDLPSQTKNHVDFIDHRHDQSIISLLYYKDPKDILLLNYHDKEIFSKFFHHRRRDMDHSLALGIIIFKFILQW
jgi:hypothetical protein